MLGKNHDKSTASWYQRRIAEGTIVSGEHADRDAEAGSHSGNTRDGWDPWEIWLRYIEQPRRIRRPVVPRK